MLPQEPLQPGSSPTTTLRKSYYPGDNPPTAFAQHRAQHNVAHASAYQNNIGSTAKGIMIGIFSVLGAAGICLIIAAIVYYFRYTNTGRIFLDRITRPGEYDDEQQFAKEEAEALETMDDLQRTEYLRAKGMQCTSKRHTGTNLPQLLCKQILPNRFRPTYLSRNSSLSKRRVYLPGNSSPNWKSQTAL